LLLFHLASPAGGAIATSKSTRGAGAQPGAGGDRLRGNDQEYRKWFTIHFSNLSSEYDEGKVRFMKNNVHQISHIPCEI